MISRRSSRPLFAATAALVLLTACGASPPPKRELANEIIDTLESDGRPLSDAVKDCMHDVADNFSLTETEAKGFKNLDEVADKAADGQEQAKAIMDRFEQELRDCNTAG